MRRFLPVFYLIVSLFFSGSAKGEEAYLPPRGASEVGRPKTESGEWLWQTDRPGFRRSLTHPILYTLVWDGVSLIFLNALDHDSTGYSAASFRNFQNAFTKGPRPDNDDWYWNFLTHPLAGSEYYLRVRAQGYSPVGSFLFTAAASTVWEFGIESWYERPSSQDLIITPLVGSLFGEARFRLKRALLKADTRFSRTLAVAVDPFESLAEVVGRAFGQDWSEPAFQTMPTGTSRSRPIFVTDISSHGGRPSFTFKCSFSF